MSKQEARTAARERAAAEREAAERKRRRTRILVIAGAVVAVLAIAGIVVGVVLSAAKPDPAAAPASAAGRTSAPPWAAPTDVEARVKAAGLTMLTAEGTALHIHQHLTVTVDGTAEQVPADIGIDEQAQRLSAIHTHDTSGIVHVESPVTATFRLGQVFAEWDVALGKGQVGGYRDGRNGARVALFVDRKPYAGDPAKLALAAHQDIDFVVTTDGSTPKAPTTAFAFPAGY
jgi:hypothetical protein